MLPNSLDVTLANTALQVYSMEGKAAVRINRCSLSVYRGETADRFGRRGVQSLSSFVFRHGGSWIVMEETRHPGHLSLLDSVQR